MEVEEWGWEMEMGGLDRKMRMGDGGWEWRNASCFFS